MTFDSIGGLKQHIRSLKEMILFPLLYPEVFDRFRIQPPRGVLFFGPPGCGKTLVARGLANECSRDGRRVAFFMRKGADCLSKWVGESERQLRLLFDQVSFLLVCVYISVCLCLLPSLIVFVYFPCLFTSLLVFISLFVCVYHPVCLHLNPCLFAFLFVFTLPFVYFPVCLCILPCWFVVIYFMFVCIYHPVCLLPCLFVFTLLFVYFPVCLCLPSCLFTPLLVYFPVCLCLLSRLFTSLFVCVYSPVCLPPSHRPTR